jgi:peptidoglycan/LPS O-acetylase OafA/YrhL
VVSSKPTTVPNRFAFVDGLRGIAVLAVVLFHFYQGSPFYEVLSQVLPKPVDVSLTHGWLGVEIFFVLSGFVIAYSLRESEINGGFLRNFMLCRYLRLSPPYLISIVLIIGLNYFSNLILVDRLAPLYGWQTLVIHLFYLQNLLQTSEISPIFWTLCLEIYFYLTFVCLLGLIQLVQRSTDLKTINVYSAVFLILGLISLITTIVWDAGRNSLFTNGYVFIAGILIYWVFERRVNDHWLWAYFLILAAFVAIRPDNLGVAATLVTGLLLWQASRSGNLNTWLTGDWIQYLGKISYSLYLLHTIIGSRVINIAYRINPNYSWLTPIWLILAFGLSLIAAHGLYVLVEKPSMRLSKQVKSRVA